MTIDRIYDIGRFFELKVAVRAERPVLVSENVVSIFPDISLSVRHLIALLAIIILKCCVIIRNEKLIVKQIFWGNRRRGQDFSKFQLDFMVLSCYIAQKF